MNRSRVSGQSNVHQSVFFRESLAYLHEDSHKHSEKPKEGIALFQCPLCGELMEALTNVHCKSRHQRTRKEVLEQYGTPKYVTPKITHEIQRWLQDVTVLSRLDFEMAQAAARNQLRGHTAH